MPALRIAAAAGLAAVLCVLGGCGGSSGGGSVSGADQTASSDAGDSAADATDDSAAQQPPAESQDAEQPDSGGGGGVAVRTAGLPTGGAESVAVGDSVCLQVGWANGSFPDGVTYTIDGTPSFDQDGFVEVGSGCGDCHDAVLDADHATCDLGVKGVRATDSDLQLQVNGKLTCPSSATCDALADAFSSGANHLTLTVTDSSDNADATG